MDAYRGGIEGASYVYAGVDIFYLTLFQPNDYSSASYSYVNAHIRLIRPFLTLIAAASSMTAAERQQVAARIERLQRVLLVNIIPAHEVRLDLVRTREGSLSTGGTGGPGSNPQNTPQTTIQIHLFSPP